jgi:hypothetical protein
VPSTEADGVPFCLVSLAREEVFWEKSELKIASFGLSISIFGLNAGVGRQFLLDKSVEDVIFLVIVCSKPVCLKASETKAEGTLPVDA